MRPHPECARSLDEGEALDVENAIEQIGGAGCDAMADWLWDMLDGGKIKTYDTDDGDYGDIHNYSTDPEVYIGPRSFNEDQVYATLRHEYGHFAEQSTNEEAAIGYEFECEGGQD